MTGLLFNRDFEVSPPFGGNQKEYEQLFRKAFTFNTISVARNSVPVRTNSELIFEFQKNNLTQVNLYAFEGITCNGCMNTVTTKFLEIEGVLNVSMNTNFSEILIVSIPEVALKTLQEIISYDEKYKINKVT